MTKQLHVTFTADVTASDVEKGVIVGKVVPYGTFGQHQPRAGVVPGRSVRHDP
jgi:hypothetical protein